MKENLILYLSKYDGGYSHRNAIRHLHKRDAVLWQKIMEKTSFLPANAKPKQRCWHILNDVWEIPLCPITGEKVKWCENRYLTYVNLRASTSDPRRQEKTKTTMMKRYGVEHALRSEHIRKKARKTTLRNHGVTNPSKSPTLMKKMKETRLSRGSYRSPEEIPDMECYYLQVALYTEESWKCHYNKINPKGLPRGKNQYHLDHIFSRIDGYRNNIPPEIIGHWSNLQMLDYRANAKKNRNSSISVDLLIERYNTNVG